MTPFQKWLLLVSSTLTGVTGLAYWYMDAFMEPVSEWAVINHPLQPWMLKAHILVAPVLLFAIGLIAGQHIWKAYVNAVQRGRRSGLLAMWVIVPMVVTGYLIQAVTAESWLAVLAWLHIGTGIAYLVGLLAHQVVICNTAQEKRLEESVPVGPQAPDRVVGQGRLPPNERRRKRAERRNGEKPKGRDREPVGT